MSNNVKTLHIFIICYSLKNHFNLICIEETQDKTIEFKIVGEKDGWWENL